jgi:hypothetical protein
MKLTILGLSQEDVEIYTRFWSKVKQLGPCDCWLWTAGTRKSGYGKFKLKGKEIRAHRFAYMITHKSFLSEHELVLHHCDNPSCCNPNHLFKGTTQDNVKDRCIKGRSKGGRRMYIHNVGGI